MAFGWDPGQARVNVIWRRDLWGHRVIVFFWGGGNVSNWWLNTWTVNTLVARSAAVFSLSAKNLWGADTPPPPGRRPCAGWSFLVPSSNWPVMKLNLFDIFDMLMTHFRSNILVRSDSDHLLHPPYHSFLVSVTWDQVNSMFWALAMKSFLTMPE